MKNSVCLYFQVHQPYRIRRYGFFDMFNSHSYFDEKFNGEIMNRIARLCYLPANELLLKLINRFPGQFHVSFSITGTALEQMESYVPEVITSFQQLAATGQVEFLAETYCHSLASEYSAEEFKIQVEQHSRKIIQLFGIKPAVFRNTELIYSNEMAAAVAGMGYKAVLSEGVDRLLKRVGPGYLFTDAGNRLVCLLKDFRRSDDVAFRFRDIQWDQYPLTPAKYARWIYLALKQYETVNLFMDYETFGEHQKRESGIFDFLEKWVTLSCERELYEFLTPSQTIARYPVRDVWDVPLPVSWADEERDLSAWTANDMQQEALNTLYAMEQKVKASGDALLLHDWRLLQTSDHFYYMSTKGNADGSVHGYFNAYSSPHDAYIYYMNVLADMEARIG